MTPFFLLCAERAARTTEGSFILHGILERMHVKAAPTSEAPLTVPSLSVAFEIRDVDVTKRHDIQVKMIHRESGVVLFDQGFPVEPSNDPAQKLSGVLNFHLLPIKALGSYETSVAVDGTAIATTSFLVALAPHGK